MAKMAGVYAPSRVQFSYQLIRNTTSPDEELEGVKSYVVNLPALEILKLDTRENLRTYIPEHNPKRRGSVHKAIRNTIETAPHRFITRNSGVVVTATAIEIDDQKKVLSLTDASLINGAQTQGEIRGWLEEQNGERDEDAASFFVRAEVIVDPDPLQVVETAIARNTAVPVKSVSQAGARGYFDDLEVSIKRVFPDVTIQKSETDEGLDTRKIIQWTRLLMPLSVSKNPAASEKLRPYKNPEQCLTDFAGWYQHRATDPDARVRYEFTVQMAPTAIREYEYWERHQAWTGQYLWEETKKGGRACRRDKNNKVIWVSPGLVFPIMGAMSEFVEETAPRRWALVKPSIFDPGKMIAQAIAQFRGVDSDPLLMGRSEGAYDALRIYPATLVEVTREVQKSRKKH